MVISPHASMPPKSHPEKTAPSPSYSWQVEEKVLHIPNTWSVIGRLFLAPFLVAGFILVGLALTGLIMEVARGRYSDLWRELPAMLGMLVVGGLLGVPCWMGVFSWYDAVVDGKKRTVSVEEGAWPWIKRWQKPASAFRAVSIEEQDLMTDTDGGGSSVTKQAVLLLWAKDSRQKPHVLERCDSYTEADALARTAAALLKIPLERTKRST